MLNHVPVEDKLRANAIQIYIINNTLIRDAMFTKFRYLVRILTNVSLSITLLVLLSLQWVKA